ncbi:hypothetical protein RRG08_041531 [Elysia crispata]|uniref:Uncharacterized protein n=1 Tax=Elysia crispata TaxID=231223 RepID=A0AAE0ZUZ7_9GAST|nr:hypothetical protein RRG08_041531 [Elysia crispata]
MPERPYRYKDNKLIVLKHVQICWVPSQMDNQIRWLTSGAMLFVLHLCFWDRSVGFKSSQHKHTVSNNNNIVMERCQSLLRCSGEHVTISRSIASNSLVKNLPQSEVLG